MNQGEQRVRGALAVVAFSCWPILLVGCSSSATVAPPAAHTTTRTSEIAPGGTVPFNLAHNARSDVRVAACTPSSGAWAMKGSVVNSTANPHSYQIVVDFVTVPGSTVLSTSVVNVMHVHSGATAAWSTTGARGASRAACLIRQAQTT